MNVNGLVPAVTGDGWFVLDKSGSFSLDEPVWADIWLIGGGCDGKDGYYDENKKIVHGGVGGDGGYVLKFGKIALFKNIEYSVKIAEPNDKTGTSIVIRGVKRCCADMGRIARKGGLESMINYQKRIVNARNGLIGTLTPIGYVGSSGGGGCAVYKDLTATFGKGGEGAGDGRADCRVDVPDTVSENIAARINAENYGCGGGGNTFCYKCSDEDVGLKSRGRGGCVIIAYEPYDEKFPDLTVRYWKKLNVARLDNDTREMVEMLQSKYLDIAEHNKQLKARLKQLESEDSKQND